MDRFKAYFNALPKNEVFTRTSLLEATGDNHNPSKPHSWDIFRRAFVIIGYIRHIRPGVYQKVKDIEAKLSTYKILRRAYPNTKTYDERRRTNR